MHLVMILVVLGIAWWLRCKPIDSVGSWAERWAKALLLFLFPPLLLIMTGVAVLCMGPQGQMVGFSSGGFSYLLAVGFFGLMGIKFIILSRQGWQAQRQARTYPRLAVQDKHCRVFNTTVPFAALIGFWQPELVVSQGLLNTLATAHVDAVITHEQAHKYYRDTFWFFWLGWLRSCTQWLPNTEALWQELLALRELRADTWAAQKVDPLVLAESLLQVVSSTSSIPFESFSAAFSVTQRNRLVERVEALLSEPEVTPEANLWVWAWLLLAFLPLAAIPFHN